MASITIISTIKKTAVQNSYFGTCSSDAPYPTQCYISSIYEETTMTVTEAKCATDSDSD